MYLLVVLEGDKTGKTLEDGTGVVMVPFKVARLAVAVAALQMFDYLRAWEPLKQEFAQQVVVAVAYL
jgi:hypothetical protein